MGTARTKEEVLKEAVRLSNAGRFTGAKDLWWKKLKKEFLDLGGNEGDFLQAR